MSNLHTNLCCGCSLESPRRGDSNEHPQHRFLSLLLQQTEEPDINPNEQKTPVEKPVRFKVVTEEELQMIENPKQSLSTQRNTKWGTKLFQGTVRVFLFEDWHEITCFLHMGKTEV